MIVLTNDDIFAASKPGELITALESAFSEPFESPDRMHCDLPGTDEAKLLIMPAWQNREAIGVKVATVMPENAHAGRPTIDGLYVLLDGQSGRPAAVLEARALTALRTAAVSALASKQMSRTNASKLLLVGTGALAPHLARAHAAVRKLTNVEIWGRDREKAAAVAEILADMGCDVSAVDDLAAAVAAADIVSCATLSNEPLIDATWVRPGTHLDFVGSFTPQMREADPLLFRNARLVVDTLTALRESGDLIEPANRGWISEPVTQLADVVRGLALGRTDLREVTIFKSVGTGLSDIAAARYFLAKSHSDYVSKCELGGSE